MQHCGDLGQRPHGPRVQGQLSSTFPLGPPGDSISKESRYCGFDRGVGGPSAPPWAAGRAGLWEGRRARFQDPLRTQQGHRAPSGPAAGQAWGGRVPAELPCCGPGRWSGSQGLRQGLRGFEQWSGEGEPSHLASGPLPSSFLSHF